MKKMFLFTSIQHSFNNYMTKHNPILIATVPPTPNNRPIYQNNSVAVHYINDQVEMTIPLQSEQRKSIFKFEVAKIPILWTG